MIPATDWDKKRRELNVNRPPHSFLKDEKHMLETLRNEYGAAWKIASVLGVSEQTIIKRMRKCGVAPSRLIRPRFSDEIRDQVRMLWASGRTALEIVAETGIGRQTVYKVLKEGTTQA